MDFSVREHTLHFKKPARTSRGEYTQHRMFLVDAFDAVSGRCGVGECAPLPDLSCDRNAYPDTDAVRALLDCAFSSGDYVKYLRAYPALLFALESSIAQCLREPSLYDTAFAKGEEGIPVNGLIWMADYEDMLGQVEKKLETGFDCIKIKIGAIAWEDELRLLKYIRGRFGADTLELRVDANGGFAMNEVMRRLDELSALGVHSIEQPVLAGWQKKDKGSGDDAMGMTGSLADAMVLDSLWDEMAYICRNTPLPIALDEELIGLNARTEREQMLDFIKPQYIVVKPTLHGGISGSDEWISLARERGIGSWITSALESNVGLKSVALLSAREYGPGVDFAQGLGTGMLFTDNIDCGVELRGNRIWIEK